MKQYLFLILFFIFSNVFATETSCSTAKNLTRRDSINNSLRVLTDSNITYRYGYYCSKNARETEGSIAINYLIKTNSIQTIKAVLDGNNKEGKIFAINALLSLAADKKTTLSLTEKEKIRSIINKDNMINCCNGCIYSERPSRSLFEGKHYKRLFKKNKITI